MPGEQFLSLLKKYIDIIIPYKPKSLTVFLFFFFFQIKETNLESERKVIFNNYMTQQELGGSRYYIIWSSKIHVKEIITSLEVT